MQKCKTTEAVMITSGLFKLSDDQVNRRMHMLKKAKGGRYRITQPITFKAGETFEYEGPVDRGLAVILGLTEKQAEKVNNNHLKSQSDIVVDVDWNGDNAEIVDSDNNYTADQNETGSTDNTDGISSQP